MHPKRSAARTGSWGGGSACCRRRRGSVRGQQQLASSCRAYRTDERIVAFGGARAASRHSAHVGARPAVSKLATSPLNEGWLPCTTQHASLHAFICLNLRSCQKYTDSCRLQPQGSTCTSGAQRPACKLEYSVWSPSRALPDFLRHCWWTQSSSAFAYKSLRRMRSKSKSCTPPFVPAAPRDRA